MPVYVGIAQFLLRALLRRDRRRAPRALAIARRTGQGQLVVTLIGLRAISLMFRLELDAALHEAEAAEEAARLQGVPHLLHFALWIRALVHDVRGEATEAERAAREGTRADGERWSRASSPAPPRASSRRSTTTRCARSSAMAAAAGPLLELADPTHRTWLLLRLVRAAIAAGDLDLAEQWAEDAVAHAERLQLAAGSVRAAVACAEVVLARGDAAEAAVVAEHALRGRRHRAGAAGRAAGAPGRGPGAGRGRRCRAPATSCSASPATRAAPARRACTRPRDASCAGSARASPLPPAAPRGATRR